MYFHGRSACLSVVHPISTMLPPRARLFLDAAVVGVFFCVLSLLSSALFVRHMIYEKHTISNKISQRGLVCSRFFISSGACRRGRHLFLLSLPSLPQFLGRSFWIPPGASWCEARSMDVCHHLQVLSRVPPWVPACYPDEPRRRSCCKPPCPGAAPGPLYVYVVPRLIHKRDR